MRRSALVAALVAVLGLAACGGSDETGALADGRHFGYVRSVDTSSDPATIEFDLAEFLTGDAADEAAVEDGAIEEGEDVPNDYYIRNEDEAVEVLPVSSEVRVTHVQCVDSCMEGLDGDFAAFAASFESDESPTLADPYRGAQSQYWVTIQDGDAVVIDEQYLP